MLACNGTPRQAPRAGARDAERMGRNLLAAVACMLAQQDSVLQTLRANFGAAAGDVLCRVPAVLTDPHTVVCERFSPCRHGPQVSGTHALVLLPRHHATFQQSACYARLLLLCTADPTCRLARLQGTGRVRSCTLEPASCADHAHT